MTVAEDTFGTSTVTYTYNPALHSSLLGEPLQIRLLALAGSEEVDFDDIELYATGSSTPLTVTVTLAVNDVINPEAVTDTMTIDVYLTCTTPNVVGCVDYR